MKGKSKDWMFIGSGLALILVVSLIDGFIFSFTHAVQHVISDVTVDAKMHAYIAGLVLLMYGLYRLQRGR